MLTYPAAFQNITKNPHYERILKSILYNARQPGSVYKKHIYLFKMVKVFGDKRICAPNMYVWKSFNYLLIIILVGPVSGRAG